MTTNKTKTKADMLKRYTELKTATTTADKAVKNMLEYRLKHKIFIITIGR